MCSPKPPKPDPAIGQAAKQNADIAQQQLDVAKQQLAWEKDRAAVQDPLVQKIVDQQITQGDANAARADEQWNIYKTMFQPVESQMVSDAMGFDSPERKDRMAAQAGADVTRSYEGAKDQNQRAMERMGVNPNSGKFQALENETNIAKAKDTAGAMNKARTDTELQGIALRKGAADFGRNMPGTGIAADSASLNAGNSAVGAMTQSNANRINSTNSALNWMGGAAGSNNSSANIGLGLYGNQLNAWTSQQDMLGGLGQGIGTFAGMVGPSLIKAAPAMLAGLRRGGMIRGNMAYRLRPRMRMGGLSSLRRSGYAEGGMIEGPGTGTSDSVPASIEGGQPIKLSNGEAVLNAEAVQLVGEPFIHNINAAGLAMLKGKTEEQREVA